MSDHEDGLEASASRTDPFELRSDPRVGTDIPVQLDARGPAGGLAARTRDLSVGGCCIATATPFDFKRVHELTLMLPNRAVSLPVQGRWQHEEPSGDLVLTGLQFHEVQPEALDHIWNLVLASGQQLARFLYEHSAIRELGLEEAMGLAQVTRLRSVPFGRTLYRQNTKNPGEDSIYIVMEGTVVLQVRVRDAIENDVARLGAGELFGGLPLMADVPHCESAVTDSDVHLLEIDRQAFRYIRTTKPWLGHRLSSALLRITAERFHHLMSHVRDLL